ncbi:UNVERIFIED_CONTAM: Steroid 5-alpha-reductase DET2 [Sesamum calycinum]|uniref:Steroid 5-alpha-reductase DET2 n=1 Tax=Sesamum calycinum TaxID=2727403 RepID=A0AAW2NU47_9LAMI
MGPHHPAAGRMVSHGEPHHMAHSPPLPLRQKQRQSPRVLAHVTLPPPLPPPHANLPLRLYLKTRNGKIQKSCFPVSVAMMAFGFNILNAYLQARWVSEYADLDGDEWFWWRLAAGAMVFFSGAVMNVWSDNVLMGLKEGGGGYKIPRGGLFEWVSCPNYFGEIWSGWAGL